MLPMRIRCGNCGKERIARTKEEAYRACERCQQAAEEGRPYFPGSAMSKASRDALKYVQAQEEYWKLSGRVALAIDGLRRAERAGEEEPSLETSIALQEAQQEHMEAEAAMQVFRKAHDGETFRVFRPEDIEQAFSSDIEPLW